MIIRELVTKLGFELNEAQLARYENSVTGLKSELKKLDVTAKKTFQGMAAAGRTATFAITAPVIAAGAAITKVAGDSVETQNRFKQVFLESSDDVLSYVDTLKATTGASKFQLQESLSSFQSFFVGSAELSNKAAAEQSKAIQTLAIDFASFNNLTDKEATQRFISGLSGSSEVFDRFGISLREASLETELLNLGFEGSVMKATEQQKIMARLGIIMKSLTRQGAVGDAVRTAGDFNRQYQAMKNDIRDTSAEIGVRLLPTMLKLVKAVRSGVEWFSGLSEAKQNLIGKAVLVAAAVGPLLVLFGSLGLAIVGISSAMPAIIAGFSLLKAGLLLFAGPLGIITAIIAAVGLLAEDIYNWVRGNKSAIGQLLGDWEYFKTSLMFIWTSIKLSITGAIDGIKDRFTGLVDSMLGRIERLKSGLQSFLGIESSGASTNGARPLGASGSRSQFNAEQLAGIRNFNSGAEFPGLGFSGIGAGGGSTQKTINVDSRINMTVPPGTSQEQTASVQKAAREAVQEEWGALIREGMNEFPEVE